MEHNGSYTSDPSHNSDREGRGGNVFVGIIIAIVLVLLALMIVGLFLPGLLGETPQEIAILDMTPTPQTEDGLLPPTEDAESPEATAKPNPTPTPFVSPEDRVLPSLDGIAPTLPGLENNTIPDIYDAVSPGVVGVLNYTQAKTPKGKIIDELYGSGTGFVVSSTRIPGAAFQ